MTIRTSKKILTVRRPFFLGGFDEVLSAGAWSVDTQEKLLEAISSLAYQRVATRVRKGQSSGARRTTDRESKELGPDLLQLALIIGAATLVGIYLG